MLSRKKFFLMAISTLLGFGALGLIIIHFFHDQTIRQALGGELNLLWQIILGSGYGVIIGLMAMALVKQPFLKSTRRFFSDLIVDLNLSWIEIFFISFCAGVGEELFFRGGIQPLIGVWITSILFVALHGYLNPKNWRISVYGLFMTLAIAGLGYLMIYFGITSAMAAHMFIDVILLAFLARKIDFQKN